LASEDIGLADPNGLVVVNAAAQAFDYIGLPEGIFPIVNAVLYLATAPKSNTTTSYFKAFKLIEDEGKVSVPNHLKDGNRDAYALGHGKGFQYPHDAPDHYLPQQYLPKEVLGTYFYTPSSQGYEMQISERLEMWRKAQRKALGIIDSDYIPDMSEEEISDLKQKHKSTGAKSKR
jgi:putative ATPase